MTRLIKAPDKRIISFLEAVLTITGLFIFALFIHSGSFSIVLAITGLTLSALSINHAVQSSTSVFNAFGFTTISKKTLIYSLAGVLVGVILGVIVRQTFGLTLLPETLTRIAIIAPLIGVTEELIFRGFVQGRTDSFGPVFSVVFAATGHALYKYFVLRSLSDPVNIDYEFLVVWTFLGGLLYGVLRELSKSVIPPATAHACFDIVVYGGFTIAPVWVWS